MCDWIREMMAFWFPEPVEQDMDGAVSDVTRDKPRDDCAIHAEGHCPNCGSRYCAGCNAPLPKPPEYLRNIPYEREAVAAAERIVGSKR